MPSYNYDTLERHARKRLSEKRFHHSKCVTKMAASLARQLGADEEKARVAGILHDICKEMPKKELLQYLHRHDILLNDDFLAHPRVWHGPAASFWIKEELGVEDVEICSAVYYHSIARAGMSPLEKAIFLGDLSSTDRTYFDAACLRSIQRDSVERAVAYCLRYIVGTVVSEGKPILRETWEAYNFYCKESSHEID